MDKPHRQHPRPLLDTALSRAGEIILGKPRVLRLSLATLLARGHLLIEDLPGVGKTTLAHTLARVLGLGFTRVQFTSDLLPADILGVSVYEQEAQRFVFHPGPVFSQVLLADEVNRATPRTQSALLEAMAERQVSLEGETRPLPEPFFVIATQNPLQQVGTFPLPESQLDRFLMRLRLGYPDAAAERELLAGRDRRRLLEGIEPVLDAPTLLALQERVDGIHASGALLDYLQALIAASRELPGIAVGLSPRAGLALLQAGKAWALLEGRDHLLPDDIQAVLPAVVTHRLRPADDSREGAEHLARELLEIPVP